MNDHSSWDNTTEFGVRMKKNLPRTVAGQIKEHQAPKKTPNVALELMNNPQIQSFTEQRKGALSLRHMEHEQSGVRMNYSNLGLVPVRDGSKLFTLKIWSGQYQMSESVSLSLSCSSEGLCLSHLEIHTYVGSVPVLYRLYSMYSTLLTTLVMVYICILYPHRTINFLIGNINAIQERGFASGIPGILCIFVTVHESKLLLPIANYIP